MKTSFKHEKSVVHHRKSERGNALALFGLAVGGLAVILGLVARPAPAYTTPENLQSIVNEAAWAASGEFKRGYTIASMQVAAQTVLDSYSVQLQSLSVATCDSVAADNNLDILTDQAQLVALDPEVCTDPLKKLVRLRVTALVEPDGLPLSVQAISEAPSLDIVLAIDTSDSMTVGWNNERVGDDRDPTQCNMYDTCFPFKHVKDAATLLLDSVYFPYDRVGVVTFDKDAVLRLPVSDDYDTVKYTVEHLQVYEGNQACPYTQGERISDPTTYPADYSDNVNPCRLYTGSTESPPNSYRSFDCAAFYGASPDASSCPTTNTSDGIALSGAILNGDYSSATSYYPAPPGGWPTVRSNINTQPVLVLLSDGAANSGHDTNGGRICPASTNSYAWSQNHPACRDADTLTRHCLSLSNTDCMNSAYPEPLTLPYPLKQNNIVDPANYDGDDRARDMFDQVAANGVLTFTIGMGSQIKQNSIRYDINGLAPGETLLKYGAFGTYTQMSNPNAPKGQYYYATYADDLLNIFLGIADQLIVNHRSLAPTPTITPTMPPTDTPSITPTSTISLTPTITSTPTLTATITSTKTRTALNTKTATRTITVTRTKTPTATLTGSMTRTPTVTATSTETSTPTETETPTETSSPIASPSGTPTETETPTPSLTPTSTVTRTLTRTPTQTVGASPTRTATATATAATLTLKSIAAQDGWVLETDETSNTGGSVNSTNTSFRVGDDAANRQYRSILSFNTAALPDNAIIQSAVIKIKYSALMGINPFNTLGNLWAQIKPGAFSNNTALQTSDFNIAPSPTNIVGVFNGPVSNWYSAPLTAIGRSNLNKTGPTQFRLRFALDDNNNSTANTILFASGNLIGAEPQLVITYSLP